jgi:hypothetical protein
MKSFFSGLVLATALLHLGCGAGVGGEPELGGEASLEAALSNPEERWVICKEQQPRQIDHAPAFAYVYTNANSKRRLRFVRTINGTRQVADGAVERKQTDSGLAVLFEGNGELAVHPHEGEYVQYDGQTYPVHYAALTPPPPFQVMDVFHMRCHGTDL